MDPTTPLLPSFNKHGLLPAGDYELSIDELRRSSLVVPPSHDPPSWDSAWRRKLVDNLSVLVSQLHTVGIWDIFVGGSFVEDKPHPNDVDGYFICEPLMLWSGELEQRLNELDPHAAWTWDPKERRPYRRPVDALGRRSAELSAAPKSSKKQLPMWHHYRVELYPHWGQWSGITNEHGDDLDFPAAFRRSRAGMPRGIIKIRGKQ
jgi:hypothetical protein